MSSKHSTYSSSPAPTYRSVLDEIREERRVQELPDMCALLLSGLYNAEDDPAPLFDGLPYEVVMAAATRSHAVRQAAARLVERHPGYWQQR